MVAVNEKAVVASMIFPVTTGPTPRLRKPPRGRGVAMLGALFAAVAIGLLSFASFSTSWYHIEWSQTDGSVKVDIGLFETCSKFPTSSSCLTPTYEPDPACGALHTKDKLKAKYRTSRVLLIAEGACGVILVILSLVLCQRGAPSLSGVAMIAVAAVGLAFGVAGAATFSKSAENFLFCEGGFCERFQRTGQSTVSGAANCSEKSGSASIAIFCSVAVLFVAGILGVVVFLLRRRPVDPPVPTARPGNSNRDRTDSEVRQITGGTKASPSGPQQTRAPPTAGGASNEPFDGDDREGTPPPPEGDWVYDEETGLFWSEENYLFLNTRSSHYYDPNTDMWYNPFSKEWYGDEDGQRFAIPENPEDFSRGNSPVNNNNP